MNNIPLPRTLLGNFLPQGGGLAQALVPALSKNEVIKNRHAKHVP